MSKYGRRDTVVTKKMAEGPIAISREPKRRGRPIVKGVCEEGLQKKGRFCGFILFVTNAARRGKRL